MDLPLDSFDVSFPDQLLILYDFDLFEQFYNGSNKSQYDGQGLNLKISKATLTGIDWFKLKTDSILNADSLIIAFEDVKIAESLIDSLTFQNTSLFKEIDIKNVVANIPSLFIGKSLSFRNTLIETQEINSSVNNIIKNKDSLNYENLNSTVNSLQSGVLDKVHKFVCNKVEIKEKNVQLHNTGIKSVFTKNTFELNPPGKITFVNLDVPLITLPFENLRSSLENRSLLVNNLNLDKLDLYVYTNGSLPKDASYIPIISEFLLNVKFPLNIRNINVNNSNIVFEMKAKDRNDTGVLSFNNISGTFDNVTNIAGLINRDKWLNVDLNCFFMSSSSFDLKVQFDLSSDQYPYNYQGNLENLDLSKINRLMEDLAALKFKEGYLNHMDFNVQGTNFHSSGQLNAFYDNLKVRHVKERSTGNPDPIKWVVNRLVIRQNNRKDRNPRVGEIDKSRELDKSMFYQMWEAILNGLTDILLPL